MSIIVSSGKRGSKRAAEDVLVKDEKKVKKHFPKVLILGTRGITYRYDLILWILLLINI